MENSCTQFTYNCNQFWGLPVNQGNGTTIFFKVINEKMDKVNFGVLRTNSIQVKNTQIDPNSIYFKSL